MTWNYHDNDVPAPDSPVRLTITGAACLSAARAGQALPH